MATSTTAAGSRTSSPRATRCSGIRRPSTTSVSNAHHLSPHIFAFGAPLAFLTTLDGIQIFAIPQGFFFALFLVSLLLMAAWRWLRTRDAIVAMAAAVLVGALSNALFQAAAYPHYEVAMLASVSLALAAWVSHRPRLFVLALVWLPFIREDGGFYAALVCLMCIALDRGRWETPRVRALALAAVAGVMISGLSLAIKAAFFPGFDAFASNFSGASWDHVTAGFVAHRLIGMIRNPNILPVIAGAVLLAVLDARYMAGVLLLSPLLLLHVLSVQPEHGSCSLYYALPWVLAWVCCLAVFARRAASSVSRWGEAALILSVSVAMTAPVQAAAGLGSQFWYVAPWSLTRPVVDIGAMRDFARWVRRDYPAGADMTTGETSYCVSMGIAALMPNDIRPHESLDAGIDVSDCRAFLLLRGDMHYSVFSHSLAARGFAPVARREHAELWLTKASAARESAFVRRLLCPSQRPALPAAGPCHVDRQAVT